MSQRRFPIFELYVLLSQKGNNEKSKSTASDHSGYETSAILQLHVYHVVDLRKSVFGERMLGDDESSVIMVACHRLEQW